METRDDAASDALAATAEATQDSRPAAPHTRPTQIGRYRVERELGAGGMGVVYAAFDSELERRIALKVLKGTTADGRTRLLREARALAKLTHPNVVTVHEVGSVDGVDFVAMELVDGESVAEWLAAEKRSPAEILHVFRAAGAGLAAAHAVGLVHRDFKPHNVLRSRDGRILVVDFGLARASSEEAAADTSLGSLDMVLTAASAWIGTPAYMSPEQWNGGAITPAVDQFAFCVALWEGLAGKRPFTGTTLEQIRQAVTSGPPAGGDEAIPRELRGLLRRGLEPDPAQRWPSMGALLSMLQPKRSGTWRKWVAVAAALVVVATVALALLTMRGGPSAPENPAAGVTKINDGTTHATPAAIKRLITSLQSGTDARFIQAMKGGVPDGVKIYGVKSGTVLDAFGLLNGDTLRGIDGHEIRDLGQFRSALAALPRSPTSLTLQLQRRAQPFDIRINRDVRR